MSNEINEVNNSKSKVLKLAKMGMLGAISIILVTFIHFPIIPGFPYLEYDPADVPILITSFAFGPFSGILLTIVVAAVQGTTVSAGSGPWGILMHIISTGTLALVAGGIYKFRKTRTTAVIALAVATISVTVVMCPANLLITPIYTGLPRAAVAAIIVPVIVPFNLIKCSANSILTFFLYKRISPLLHK